jgi:tetratricopeptide (TPR) repeat protein
VGRGARTLALAGLGVLALAAAGPAAGQGGAPATRTEAVARLGAAEPEARRQAAAWLGEHGLMADVAPLLAALRDEDVLVRLLAHQAIWEVWSRSGDPEVDALFQAGLEQMRRREHAAAIETFSRVIERKPDFAEGWNKRATLYYLVGEYERSLRDCDEVMKRNPVHFGALAGYGQIYLRLGQPARALPYFERALALNPTLEQVEEAVETLRELLRRRPPDRI